MPHGDTTRHVNGDRGVEMYKAAVHFQRGKECLSMGTDVRGISAGVRWVFGTDYRWGATAY